VRLHPQSGCPPEARSKGALGCTTCQNFNNTPSPLTGEARWGWKKEASSTSTLPPSPSPSHQGRGISCRTFLVARVGRTYPGPPSEVEGLITTNLKKLILSCPRVSSRFTFTLSSSAEFPPTDPGEGSRILPCEPAPVLKQTDSNMSMLRRIAGNLHTRIGRSHLP